jgi:hypothetical protein
MKKTLDRLISKLSEHVDASLLPDLPETDIAEYMAVSNAYLYEEDEGVLKAEAREVAAKLAAYVARHEPEECRPVRRVSELVNSDDASGDEVSDWFAQLTNDVGVSLENTEFCAADAPSGS